MESSAFSIDWEPRTLYPGQLSNARVEAAGIFMNRDTEEASFIFSQGKKECDELKVEEKEEQYHEVIAKNDEES